MLAKVPNAWKATDRFLFLLTSEYPVSSLKQQRTVVLVNKGGVIINLIPWLPHVGRLKQLSQGIIYCGQIILGQRSRVFYNPLPRSMPAVIAIIGHYNLCHFDLYMDK